MKRTKLIGILSGLLSIVMLLAVCSGCSDDDIDEGANGSASLDVSENNQDGQYDSNGYLRDELPSDLGYDGVDINILGWNSEVAEYTAEGNSSSAIDQAIFKRNETIESRLNVNLNFDLSVNGHNSARDDYADHVERSVISGGTGAYDIVSAHTGSIVACTLKGILTNLGNLNNSYIDFDKPWWNSSVMEAASIGNTFYFCTGDASTSFAQMIYCVYFNADMIESFSLTSPYDYVKNNEWTYENMLQMGMNIYQDLNNNNEVDVDDEIPLVGQYYDWPALLDGCGIQMVSKDNSGVFIIDPAIKGTKAIEVMDTLSEFVQLDGAFVATDKDINKTFMSGRAMFYLVQNGAAARWSFANTGFVYGCVPIPKYDTTQERYYCAGRKPISLFAVPKGHDDAQTEIISAVLECYGSEGYRTTTPVIFDQVMKYQNSANVQMTEMLTLIRDSACFDAGRLYSSHLGSICDMPGYYLRDNRKWENYINQEMSRVETLLGTLSDELINVGA